MKVKNINIQYHPVIEKEPIGIDPNIIEKLFNEVEITKTSDTKYLFDFHDKKDEVRQTEFNFDGIYTNYKDWSDRFLVYFAFMVTVHREAHEFSRAILNSEDAEEFNVDGNKYLDNLRKKASKFLLRMTLQEIDAINHNTVNNLLEYIARGVELSTDYFNDNILIGLGSGRKESLAMALGLFGSGNFFIDFLSTSTWSIDQVKSFIKDNGQCVHQLVIKFNNSEDELNVSICTDNKNTYKFLESDISLLQEKKQFCPYFTDNSRTRDY